jgi:uncharacterized membrane protein YfcA
MDLGGCLILIGGALAGGFVSGLAGFGTALTTLALSRAVPADRQRPDDRRVLWAAALTLPATIASSLLGAHLYHKVNDRHFRNIVLALLFLSGVALIFSGIL